MTTGAPVCRVTVVDHPLAGALHRVVDVPCDGRTVAAAALELVGVRVVETASAGVGEHAVVLLDGRWLRDGDARLSAVLSPCDRLTVTPAGPGDGGLGTLIAIVLTVASAAASYVLTPRARGAEPDRADGAQRLSFGRYSRAAARGEVIPVVFGEHARYGPVRVSAVPGEGDDGDSTLRLLYVLGEGPFARIGTRTTDGDDLVPGSGPGQIGGIYLNDQPLENFPGCRVSVRMGAAGQRWIPGFRDTEVPRDVGAAAGGALLANTSGADRAGADAAEAVTYTTVDPVDAVVLRVALPRGLYRVSSKGQVVPRAVAFRWRWRAYPGGSFGAWTTKVVERADQNALVVAPRIDDVTPGAPPARIEVQVQRVSRQAGGADVSDELRLLQVVEVQYATNRHEGCALLALRLKASEQLTSEPRVSVDVRGYAGLRVWDGVSDPGSPSFATGWSDDPADIALALLTDPRVGLGDQLGGDAGVDLPSLLACRAYNRQPVPRPPGSGGGTRPRFACNLILADDRAAVEVVRTVAETMRAAAVFADRVRFVQERPRPTPAEVFTDGSIAREDGGRADFAVTYTLTRGGIATPNQLRAQYASGRLNGETDLVTYPEAGELWLGGSSPEPVNAQTVKLEGVTDPDQARAETVFRLTRLRALDRAVVFTTTSPWVVCGPGDRIDVAASVAGWGAASGRLLEGSTSAVLRLDRTLTVREGAAYAVRVVHLDGLVEVRPLALAAGVYPAGAGIPLETALDVPPVPAGAEGLGAEYAVGEAGREMQPMLVTAVERTAGGGGGGGGEGGAPGGASAGGVRISAVPYDAGIYDPEPGDVVVGSISSLGAERSAPGPVLDLTLRERTVVAGAGGYTTVDLAWRQRPEDRQNTAGFRVYRRLRGTGYWQLVPGVAPGLTGADLGVLEPDTAWEFRVVAFSPLGAALSVGDPRHPTVGAALGLSVPAPAAPASASLSPVAGNLHRLSWPAVEGAAEYQVLTGGDAGTGRPNDGAEDCLVLARTAATSLEGLTLAPGVAHRFWVRSAGPGGRLSRTAATAAAAGPGAPAGQSVRFTLAADLAGSGTAVNAAWDAGAGRLRITDADAGEGSWTSGPLDLGSATLTELTLRAGTANDAADPDLASAGFGTPSLEADQWGVVSGSGATAAVGMLMPPWPDGAQRWTFEVASSVDGAVWSDWTPLPPGSALARTLRWVRVRARMARGTPGRPYRPALRSLTLVGTH